MFMSFLFELFTNETDLAVADRLTIAMSDLANEDFTATIFEQIQNWWLSHHKDYTNWPVEELTKGLPSVCLNALFTGRWKLRSGATSIRMPMLRAYAIACCYEIGQTNRAVMLAKDFKDPSGRWKQWAKAKAELESGNISNATVLSYKLSTNFPTMSQLPNPNYDIYRHVDWALFNKLKEARNP